LLGIRETPQEEVLSREVIKSGYADIEYPLLWLRRKMLDVPAPFLVP
jgi:hypothetical protein